MEFSHQPQHDLTYDDVFFLPSRSSVPSRFNVDLSSDDGTGTTIPLIAANMTAVSGRRMAEVMARRGGVAILPQDLSNERLTSVIRSLKERDVLVDKALTVRSHTTVGQVRSLLPKRPHGVAVVVDENNRPLGVVAEEDLEARDAFTQVGDLATQKAPTLRRSDVSAGDPSLYVNLQSTHHGLALITNDDDTLVGVLTAKGVVRSSIYRPALDKNGGFRIGIALGINGDVAGKAEEFIAAGADILVLDTAHGHQEKMIEALKKVRAVVGPRSEDPNDVNSVRIAAGNIVTADGVRDLVAAGADILKVGVGPGAMCTTRMQTGVGRPQFSAVLDCSVAARELGARVWADGGVRHPRDVALALAAGASNVMIGSWFAGTYESPGEMRRDERGRLYKESFGMASKRAVKHRTASEDAFAQARKALFEEGISTSRMYLRPGAGSVEDLIDSITAGVRSSCTYAGAANLAEFRERARIGLQSASGYAEGRPLDSSWS
ncbi:GuaB1 family IMP dehydrogenase-related protein [Dermabacteraceae bacterium P13138]